MSTITSTSLGNGNGAYATDIVVKDLDMTVSNYVKDRTPVTNMAMSKKRKVNSTLHIWPNDYFRVPALNAKLEGAAVDASAAADNTRSNLGNYTQIFTTVIGATGTARAVEQAGGDPQAYQEVKQSTTSLAKLKAPIYYGSTNKGVFNIGRILENYVTYDWNFNDSAASAFPITLANNIVNATNYRLTYKVTNMPEDGIAYMEIQDGANAVLSNTQNNGEFAEYLTPYTGPTAQPFVLANPEAQNGIIYDITIDEMCYNHQIRITYPDGSPASIWYDSSSVIHPIQYFKDRIVWCFTWEDLISYDNPFAGLDSDCYTISIEDNCIGSITTQSYTIINYKATGSHDCSVIVQGINQGNAFGFFFNDPSTAVEFILIQRLRILQFNPMYPVKTEQYTFSNGTMNRTYAETGKVRTAWFDYVDEPTHDVIRLQLLSDTLIIGSEPFFCIAEDYEPEWGQNGKYNLAQSRAVLMAQNEPRLFNKNCI